MQLCLTDRLQKVNRLSLTASLASHQWKSDTQTLTLTVQLIVRVVCRLTAGCQLAGNPLKWSLGAPTDSNHGTRQ